MCRYCPGPGRVQFALTNASKDAAIAPGLLVAISLTTAPNPPARAPARRRRSCGRWASSMRQRDNRAHERRVVAGADRASLHRRLDFGGGVEIARPVRVEAGQRGAVVVGVVDHLDSPATAVAAAVAGARGGDVVRLVAPRTRRSCRSCGLALPSGLDRWAWRRCGREPRRRRTPDRRLPPMR